jgi:hypothetical protein
MARHWQESIPGFSILFDEYPDRIDTALFLSPFICKGT